MNTALLQWRERAVREIDHERLWLAVGAGAAGLVVLGACAGLQHPRCLFHLATGYPCPGCGSTRAMIQLLHGHVAAALAFNPLTTVAAFAAGAWALYAAAVVGLRLPRLRVGPLPRGWATGLRVAAVAAVLGNWAWVLAHGW